MDISTLTGGALEPVVGWIRANPQSAFLAFAGALLLLLFWLIALTVRFDTMQRRQRRLLRGSEGASLETMLLENVAAMDGLRAQLNRNDAAAQANAQALANTLQHVGLVRYDSFADIGGHQSFALALLNDAQSGIVFSAIVSRNDVRVYAKAMTRGQASQKLSVEEERAVRGAMVGGGEGGGPPFVEM